MKVGHAEEVGLQCEVDSKESALVYSVGDQMSLSLP